MSSYKALYLSGAKLATTCTTKIASGAKSLRSRKPNLSKMSSKWSIMTSSMKLRPAHASPVAMKDSKMADEDVESCIPAMPVTLPIEEAQTESNSDSQEVFVAPSNKSRINLRALLPKFSLKKRSKVPTDTVVVVPSSAEEEETHDIEPKVFPLETPIVSSVPKTSQLSKLRKFLARRKACTRLAKLQKTLLLRKATAAECITVSICLDSQDHATVVIAPKPTTRLPSMKLPSVRRTVASFRACLATKLKTNRSS